MTFHSEKMQKIKPSGIRELFAKAQGIPDTISLGIGAPDITTPEVLKREMRYAVDFNYNNYDQSPGNPKLRTMIARKYKEEYGVDYSSDGVLITCGGVQLVYTALQTYLGKGDEVLIQDPSFLTYPHQVHLAGGKTVWMPSTSDFKIDIEKMKELVNDKTKMMILNFPSNPTGAIMEKHELKALVDIAVDHNLMIISDEVYEYYTFDEKKHVHIGSIDDAYERTLTANSFSKTFAIPGWRIGFGVSTVEIMKPMIGYHTYVIANATTPAQVALANYMHTDEAKEFQKYIKNEFQQRRDAIVDGFNSIEGIKCHKSSGSFYCYPDISESKYPTGEEFSNKAFEDARVVLVPGTEFGPTQTKNIRASFGSVNLAKIEDVIHRLTRMLEQSKGK
jgi:aspartate/methionine/tyrosine aminotransferase